MLAISALIPMHASELLPEQRLQSYINLLRQGSFLTHYDQSAPLAQTRIHQRWQALKAGLAPEHRHQINAILSLLQQDNAAVLLSELISQLAASMKNLSAEQRQMVIDQILRLLGFPKTASSDPDTAKNRQALAHTIKSVLVYISQEPDPEMLIATCEDFCKKLKSRQLKTLKQIEQLDNRALLSEIDFLWTTLKATLKQHDCDINALLTKTSCTGQEIDAQNRLLRLSLPSMQGIQQLRLHVVKQGQHWRLTHGVHQIQITP